MIARYEAETASPTIRTLERVLQAAGRQLVLDTIPAEPTDSPLPKVLPRVQALREQILNYAQAIGATNVRLFGSVARGEDSAASDIDFIVDFPARERGLMPLLELATQLESLLGRPVDVAAEELLRPEIKARALAEAVAL